MTLLMTSQLWLHVMFRFLVSSSSLYSIHDSSSSLLILVPRAHEPSDLRQGSRALAGPDFLSMRRVIVPYSQPINLLDLKESPWIADFPCWTRPELTRALDPCRRSEGSWALETRMKPSLYTAIVLYPLKVLVREINYGCQTFTLLYKIKRR